jgi:AbrB family looped-hinge helix DNA binding protein
MLISATMLETEVVKVGKRYTVVIPKGFREKLGVKEGQLTEVTLEAGRLVLVPKVSDPFKRLSELIGEITYDEKTEKRAERWLLGRA